MPEQKIHQKYISLIKEPAAILNPDGKILVANEKFIKSYSDSEGNLKDLIIPASIKNQFSLKKDFELEISVNTEPILLRGNYISDEDYYLIIIENNVSELEQARKDFQSFVYKVSHDLKGPIYSITTLTEMGKAECKEPLAQQFFDMILASTKKTEVLMDKLLEVSRINSYEIQIEKFSMADLCEEIISEIETKEKIEKFKFLTDLSITEIKTDRYILKLILSNLFINSLWYRNRKIPDSYCKIGATLDDHEYKITISDNGMGIEKSKLEKVFDLFYRGSDYSLGVGLGLYIVRTGISRLKGTLKMESEKDKGMKIILQIPL